LVIRCPSAVTFRSYASSCINRLARQEREKEQQEKEQKKPVEPEKDEQEPDKKKKKKDKNKAKAEAENKESEKELQPIDENFRRICKIYIGHSVGLLLQ